MHFSAARFDGLLRRLEAPGVMTEVYDGRSDFLYERQVVFDPELQFIDLVDGNVLRLDKLQKVVERYRRNRASLAHSDVAERSFLVALRKVEVTFHLEEQRFIPSKRILSGHDGTAAGQVSSFYVDHTETLCEADMQQMITKMLNEEEEVMSEIKRSHKQVANMVLNRQLEDAAVQFLFSPWTMAGAARAQSQREQMMLLAEEEDRWMQEKEKDILGPLMIHLDQSEPLNAAAAEQLYHDCLSAFRTRLMEKVNLIQERYDKETQELQEKQSWYQKNQNKMDLQQKKEYKTFCSQKTLRVQVAKKRLDMHREAAPLKYRSLVQQLKEDPRLSAHLSPDTPARLEAL